MDWILLANGPGEVSGHVLPIAREIKRQYPSARVTLMLVPCQFASGHEAILAKEQIPELDRVFSPKEFRKMLFNKKAFQTLQLHKKGAILLLGGDQFYAVVLRKRIGYPAFAYFEQDKKPKFSFKEVFTPKQSGVLMVDSVPDCLQYAGHDINDKELIISLAPGSRPNYIEFMIPFMWDISKQLKKKIPHLQFCWGLPVHMRSFATKKFPKEVSSFPFAGDCGKLDLMITLLGTHTALTAIQGIPMIVLFPFHRPELIPLTGLPGLLAGIPFFGQIVQRLALLLVSKKLGLVALPNMKAKREITPELKGYFSAEQVADRVHSLLAD